MILFLFLPPDVCKFFVISECLSFCKAFLNLSKPGYSAKCEKVLLKVISDCCDLFLHATVYWL